MANTTIEVFNIDVLDLGLPKRNRVQFNHKLIDEQIAIENYPRCRFHCSTNLPSEYDEDFTVEVVRHYYIGARCLVDVRITDGKNTGKNMTKISFSKFTKGDFCSELKRVVNDTEQDVEQEKTKMRKMYDDLLEQFNIEKFKRKRAEKRFEEEREQRVSDSRYYEDALDEQFKRTRSEYGKRKAAEDTVDKQYKIIAHQNAEIEQLKYEVNYYKNKADSVNIDRIIMYYDMGFSAEEIEKMMGRK